MKGPVCRIGLAAALALAALAALVAPAVSACGSGAHSPSRAAQRVVVDTDMSSDDIMALAYLLEKPGISVRAITVEGTGVADGPSGAQNAGSTARLSVAQTPGAASGEMTIGPAGLAGQRGSSARAVVPASTSWRRIPRAFCGSSKIGLCAEQLNV
jgi:hypothetical protein